MPHFSQYTGFMTKSVQNSTLVKQIRKQINTWSKLSTPPVMVTVSSSLSWQANKSHYSRQINTLYFIILLWATVISIVSNFRSVNMKISPNILNQTHTYLDIFTFLLANWHLHSYYCFLESLLINKQWTFNSLNFSVFPAFPWKLNIIQTWLWKLFSRTWRRPTVF